MCAVVNLQSLYIENSRGESDQNEISSGQTIFSTSCKSSNLLIVFCCPLHTMKKAAEMDMTHTAKQMETRTAKLDSTKKSSSEIRKHKRDEFK